MIHHHVHRYGEFLKFNTPDKDIWSVQSLLVRTSQIRAVKLHRKMSRNGGPDNAVEVVHGRVDMLNREWIRCPSLEVAKEMYSEAVTLLKTEGF